MQAVQKKDKISPKSGPTHAPGRTYRPFERFLPKLKGKIQEVCDMLIGRLRKPKPAARESDVTGQPAMPIHPIPSKKSTASTETHVASSCPSKLTPSTPAVAETAHAATTPALDETSTGTPSSPKKKKKKNNNNKGKSGSSTPAETAHTPALGETSTGAPSTKKKKKKGKKKTKAKSEKGQERKELVDALKRLVEILARNGCMIEDENGVPVIVFIRNPFGDESGEVDVRNNSLCTRVLIDSSCR